MQESPTNQLRWVWLSALVILLDQGSKWLIQKTLTLDQSREVFPFLNLLLKHNAGAAFSFLSLAGGWQRWFFVIVGAAIAIFILVLLAKLPKRNNWTACAMALVLGGAIANLYDRFFYGYVVDFFDFHVNNWHFATFNVADSAISIGVVIWLLASLKTSD